TSYRQRHTGNVTSHQHFADLFRRSPVARMPPGAHASGQPVGHEGGLVQVDDVVLCVVEARLEVAIATRDRVKDPFGYVAGGRASPAVVRTDQHQGVIEHGLAVGFYILRI